MTIMTKVIYRLSAALVLGLAACSPSTEDPAACSVSQAYQGDAQRSVPVSLWQRDFTDVDGALDAQLVANLDTTFADLVTRYPAINATVMIPGEGTWTRSGGVINNDSQEPVGGNALFQVASITKSFVAVVVLQLVEEELLDLDMTVGRWFPDVPKSDVMTVRDLLTHTSGLVSFNALPNARQLADRYHPPAELVEIAAEYDVQFCPGSAWAYSNTGYVMLGMIVEDVTGRPFAEVLEQRITQPLGLENTRLRQVEVAIPEVVTGHVGGEPIAETDYATPFTAGGLVSTSHDLAIFLQALLAGEVISDANLRAAFTNMYPMQPFIPTAPDTESFYGYGVQLTDAPSGEEGPGLMLEHSGGITGFNAMVAYLVEDNAFVAITVSDETVPAAAGLWQLARTLRGLR